RGDVRNEALLRTRNREFIDTGNETFHVAEYRQFAVRTAARERDVAGNAEVNAGRRVIAVEARRRKPRQHEDAFGKELGIVRFGELEEAAVVVAGIGFASALAGQQAVVRAVRVADADTVERAADVERELE